MKKLCAQGVFSIRKGDIIAMGSDLLLAQWLGTVETLDTVDRWLLVGVIDVNIWISFLVEANH